MEFKDRPTRRTLLRGGLAFATSLATTSVMSSPGGFPSQPITIVVGYPPGGETDFTARLLGQKLSARLGQPVLVENRPGASGTIAAAYVSKAANGGHTLLLAPNGIVLSPLVMRLTGEEAQNPNNNLTPIIQLGDQPLFIVVNASLGVNSVAQLIAAAKAGRIRAYATPGSGSPMHVLGSFINKSEGLQLTQVAYRGSGPGVADVVAGHVPLIFSALGAVAPFISSGKLTALAVADPKRSIFMPSVPTVAEAGLKNCEVVGWQALFGPKTMPASELELLNSEVNAILTMPDVQKQLAPIGLAPIGGSPSKLQGLVTSDFERYGAVVKEFNIRAD